MSGVQQQTLKSPLYTQTDNGAAIASSHEGLLDPESLGVENWWSSLWSSSGPCRQLKYLVWGAIFLGICFLLLHETAQEKQPSASAPQTLAYYTQEIEADAKAVAKEKAEADKAEQNKEQAEADRLVAEEFGESHKVAREVAKAAQFKEQAAKHAEAAKNQEENEEYAKVKAAALGVEQQKKAGKPVGDQSLDWLYQASRSHVLFPSLFGFFMVFVGLIVVCAASAFGPSTILLAAYDLTSSASRATGPPTEQNALAQDLLQKESLGTKLASEGDAHETTHMSHTVWSTVQRAMWDTTAFGVRDPHEALGA